LKESEQLLLALLNDDPNHVASYVLLSDIYYDLKQYPQSMQAAVYALKIDPSQSAAWRNLGVIHATVEKQYESATNFLSKALELDPHDANAYYTLGYVSFVLHQYQDAIAILQKGLELIPNNANILCLLGRCQLMNRQGEDARRNIFKALELAPDNAVILSSALHLSEVLELDEEELDLLHKTCDKNQDQPDMAASILIYKARQALKEKDYDAAKDHLARIDDTHAPQNTLISKNFILAKILQKEKDHDQAFKLLVKANDLSAEKETSTSYKKETIYEKIGDVRDHLEKDSYVRSLADNPVLKDHHAPYSSPHFLIGFPRSGTTLSGRILSRHGDITVSDEEDGIDQLKFYAQSGFGLNFIEDLPKLDKDQLAFLHDKYDEMQSRGPSSSAAPCYIDKLPLNVLNVTQIHALFPQAKFLYISRHPLDSVLSGFMQNFLPNYAMIHFNAIEDIAKLYKASYELWKLQKEKLPIRYLEYRYEDMVADFDGQIGQIVNFLDLEWDDSVHDFYKKEDGDKVILTPSKNQISQKLYSGSQNRWKNYEKQLAPAIEILEPVIKELGYSLD